MQEEGREEYVQELFAESGAEGGSDKIRAVTIPNDD